MRRIYSARRRRRAFDPCVGFRARHAYTGRIFVVVVINTHLSVSMRAWDRCSLAVSRTYIHTYTYVYVASQLASCRPRPSMLQWRLLPSLLPNHCINISSQQCSICNLADCLVGVGAAEEVWIDLGDKVKSTCMFCACMHHVLHTCNNLFFSVTSIDIFRRGVRTY